MNIREEVLRLLEEKRRDALAGKGTGALSGESAAKRLGVSRAAVWKAVSALRKEGYNVNAATRRGYSLDKSSDTLTEEGVRACLTPDGPVRRVICLETVDSTNNYAKKLTNAENGTLIIANQQTAGRGRRGHSFVSPPGTGLYMTLVLRPSGAGENPLREAAEMERFQMITLAAAVAVCLTLEELTPVRPLIKWVNDVFLRGGDGVERKVCGILSEAVTGVESGEIESVVVGIGVNLTTRDFGGGLDGIAGSVFPEGVGRAPIAAGIAERLTAFSGQLLRGETADLLSAYRERSLLQGREITYLRGAEEQRGRVIDIDDEGGLVVEDEAEGRITLRSGEVHELRPLDGPERKENTK